MFKIELGFLASVEDTLRNSKEVIESFGAERRFGKCWCNPDELFLGENECMKQWNCKKIKETLDEINRLLSEF